MKKDRATAQTTVSRWHVSPLVDALAYHWSWLFALLPALAFGGDESQFWPVLLVVLGINFSHRLLTLPYVYLDRAVFRTAPRKFLVFPLLMLALFLAAPALELRLPGGKVLIAAAAGFAAAWNVWHVLMQKFGILRIYAAKSGLPLERRTPAWVDRLLIFAPIPLVACVVLPTQTAAIDRFFRTSRSFMPTLLEAFQTAAPIVVPCAWAILVFASVAFLRAELRAEGPVNRARLGMAAGITALNLSFLVFDPVKVYLAYGATHAIEYTVFVYAYQRRRYQSPQPHRPLLERLLRRPLLSSGVMLFGCGAIYVLGKFWGTYVFAGEARPMLLGVTTSRWLFYFAIFQSMVHFYFDGFLWKMRVESVRAHL